MQQKFCPSVFLVLTHTRSSLIITAAYPGAYKGGGPLGFMPPPSLPLKAFNKSTVHHTLLENALKQRNKLRKYLFY